MPLMHSSQQNEPAVIILITSVVLPTPRYAFFAALYICRQTLHRSISFIAHGSQSSSCSRNIFLQGVILHHPFILPLPFPTLPFALLILIQQIIQIIIIPTLPTPPLDLHLPSPSSSTTTTLRLLRNRRQNPLQLLLTYFGP